MTGSNAVGTLPAGTERAVGCLVSYTFNEQVDAGKAEVEVISKGSLFLRTRLRGLVKTTSLPCECRVSRHVKNTEPHPVSFMHRVRKYSFDDAALRHGGYTIS